MATEKCNDWCLDESQDWKRLTCNLPATHEGLPHSDGNKTWIAGIITKAPEDPQSDKLELAGWIRCPKCTAKINYARFCEIAFGVAARWTVAWIIFCPECSNELKLKVEIRP